MDMNTAHPHKLNSSITATHHRSSIIDLSRPPVDEFNSNNHQTFQAQPQPQPIVTHYECLKNHGVATGGHVRDGCAEFMLIGDGSLMCAACSCHQSFHRPVVEVPRPIAADPTNYYFPVHRNNLNPPVNHCQLVPGSGSRSQGYPGGTSTGVANRPLHQLGTSKRKRTRFNEEQKKKMMELANEVGWNVPKLSNEVLNKFCSDVGVDRKVLKSWMYNNKNTYGKKEIKEKVASGHGDNRIDLAPDYNGGINGPLGSS